MIMKTIFLFVRSLILTPDLLHTDYLKYLSQRYHVVVFNPFLDDERARKESYFSSPNVSYRIWNLKNRRVLAAFKFLRTACIRQLDFVSSVKIFYGSGAFLKDKRARLLRFLSSPLKKWMAMDFFTSLESFFIKIPPEFMNYCRVYKPSLIITATPGIQLFEAEAILLAKKLGIPTLATNFSWDNLMSFKAVRVRQPDFLFVWNDVMKKTAVDVHRFDPDKVFVTGIMRFDRYFNDQINLPTREEFLSAKGLNPKYKTILFATASRNFSYNLELIRDIIDWRASGRIPYSNLLIRLHPVDRYSVYGEFFRIPDVFVEPASREAVNYSPESKHKLFEMDNADFANLKATLAYTDLNINFKSTITLESLIFDKPVINYTDPTQPLLNQIYFNEHSYYHPIVKHGAVRISSNKDELANLINEYFSNPKLDHENRRKVVDMYLPFRDSKSYKRNVDMLEEII